MLKYNRTNRTDRLNKAAQDPKNWHITLLYDRAMGYRKTKSGYFIKHKF